MKTSHSTVSSMADVKRVPLHDEIAQCAKDLWIRYGKPTDRDQAIWLEAEQQLLAANPPSPARESESASGASSPRAQAKRARVSTSTNLRRGASQS
jgi:hypothetical protein